MQLLGQCQDAICSVYDFIVEIEGDENLVLNELSDYYKIVYEIYSDLESGQNLNYRNTSKRLRKFLLNIENSIKNNIEIRREIVFLPYKASMWDSLESVWEKMSIEPNCDTYVIPIPYYNRNSDGTLGDLHYEADRMPDKVKVEKYDDYDFKKRKPDEIYIHNPYDGRVLIKDRKKYYCTKITLD
ncbi:MAG: hypothetical protein ACK5LY_00985 [Lachnospirales bacterium]